MDGRAAHPAEGRWRDFRRDAAAQQGETVLRYGLPDALERPCEIASQVAEILWRNGWAGDEHPCGLGCRIYPEAGNRLWIS